VRLAEILDSAVEGFFQTTPDGRFLAANRALAGLLGYESRESLMAAVDDIGSGLYVEPQRRRQLVSQLTELGRVSDFEVQLRRRDRSSIWAAVNARAVVGAARDVRYIEGFIQDITERKEAEQLKADFVSFATHQLRTPLTGIRWLLELAGQEADVPAEAGEFIRDAQASTERLIKLVNDLLDATRLERRKVVLDLQPMDLVALTDGVLKELLPLIREKGHRLQWAPAGEPMLTQADPQLLRQVLLNLLSNAIKYTRPEGEIAVRLRRIDGGADCGERNLEGDDTGKSGEDARDETGIAGGPPAREPGGWARAGQGDTHNPQAAMVAFSVRDSGVGIPQEAQRRLFEKFFRAANVLSLETEGTGLGLYIVKLIVEQHGGRICCESEENRGATFTVELPAYSSEGCGLPDAE
jgi:Amt family ammonium transporter